MATARRKKTKTQSRLEKPASATKARPRHLVEADETHNRVPLVSEALPLNGAEKHDALREELGETFVENVTGADDAATAHRSDPMTEEQGGPFLITTGVTEFGNDADPLSLHDELEALPTVSKSMMQPKLPR